jgi:3'-5' exoribonuclease
MLKDLKAGEKVCQAVIIRVQKVGNSSNGGVFAKGMAEDNSGRLQFISFEKGLVNELRNLDGPKAMMVTGNVDLVKYSQDMALQIIVQKLDPLLPEDDVSNLLPKGNFDLEAYKKELQNLINQVKKPSMHQLLIKIFSEPFLSAFCKNPAGMKMHHAYMGGLLKHTVDVTKLALAITEAEGGADKDMVVAGALLHDIGKVKEISSGVGFPYTTEGRLLGHISISAQIVKKTAEEMSLPWSQVQFLEHVILSHHGEQDKGSPVACATKEAFIVHYADEIDAVLNQFADPDRHHSWTFNKMLQRYLYNE